MLFMPYLRFHILVVWATVGPPIEKTAAHLAYDMFRYIFY